MYLSLIFVEVYSERKLQNDAGNLRTRYFTDSDTGKKCNFCQFWLLL